MWVATVLHQPVGPLSAVHVSCPSPKLFAPSLRKVDTFRFRTRYPFRNFKVSAAKKQLTRTRKTELWVGGVAESEKLSAREEDDGGFDIGWLPSFPHVLVASMSNFLFGYHIGVMNGPIVSVARELGFEGNPILEGLVVSIFIVGAFLGSICSGSIVDKIGCRRTFQIDTIPLILGALISAQAHSLDEVIWGRFLVGLGIGVNAVLVPIYISEIAPTKYRGSLGSLCQIGTCLGIIASLFLGIPSESDPHWWRLMLYTASVPGFILALGMQFAVDSPRWLCKVGRMSDAKAVIQSLWGESEVERAIEDFQSVIKDDGSDMESRWLELLQEPHSRAAFIGGALFILQQFSGALGALYLIDRQGRQKLLIGSYLGMGVSMLLVVFAITFPLDGELGHNLSILGTLLYIFTFAVGAGPVTGLIIPEISSSRTRGKIMGFSFSTHWVCNFLVGLFFLELVEKFGVAPVYACFGGTSLLAAVFATYFVVETKGRSLEEIEMSLNPNTITREK
ncbi:probable plastidic glucose transporter 1 isoform X4 [Ziziphus jujuba]|uniref:Probable plastidic glucose transporter 1 isoform X4 n=1 Tax=Ziziphus jujuba TaxID=326968 RepID=A0A6P6G4G6_ZIZJJ|nr:probable plastidic glucose transporter 1 isoform X4 [Ziziphus jujuba]